MAIQDEIPKSRITLRYKTEVQGKPEDVTLPLRLMVTGDLSQGSSADRKVDLEERRMRTLDGTNLDAVMKDMGMSMKFAVTNKIDPENAEDMEVDLPINGMKSFSPDEVAKHVPKLKGILQVKKLLEEVVSNVDNRKEFRKLLNDLMSNEEALGKMVEQLKGYESLKLQLGKKTE
ncbi:MAG TPA: type VI secretion system contractile sheath small subunit [Smithellaceae bacterium]|jgi:type VI secretion system protein ImpB|nr:type VI secretion system contractile sheath small subunit [Smithellaceae bacterium]HQM44690.1 type VI secretion system contractile sheath small subunit [Smithellaceae bacterium]